MKKATKDNIIVVLLFITSLVLMIGSIKLSLDLPVVYKNADTRKCVYIETPTGMVPCDTLPEKYSEVLIDPSITIK